MGLVPRDSSSFHDEAIFRENKLATGWLGHSEEGTSGKIKLLHNKNTHGGRDGCWLAPLTQWLQKIVPDRPKPILYQNIALENLADPLPKYANVVSEITQEIRILILAILPQILLTVEMIFLNNTKQLADVRSRPRETVPVFVGGVHFGLDVLAPAICKTGQQIVPNHYPNFSHSRCPPSLPWPVDSVSQQAVLATYLIPRNVGKGIRLGSESQSGGVWKYGNLENLKTGNLQNL